MRKLHVHVSMNHLEQDNHEKRRTTSMIHKLKMYFFQREITCIYKIDILS